MVKNEADIIESVVRHLLDQDVDHILVVDNNSDDDTVDILRRLSRSKPVHVGFDHEPAYYQSHKMTRLAQAARRAGASWVIPFDADEFWFALDGTVGRYLTQVTGSRVTAEIFNAFPTKESQEIVGLNEQLRLDLAPHFLRKVAAKPHPLLWIETGNHIALRPGREAEGLRIIHIPWRNRAQLERKIRQGSTAISLTGEIHIGEHWLEQNQKSSSALGDAWSELLEGRAEPSLGWYPVGPFLTQGFAEWKTWDPDHVIPDLPEQRTAR